MNEKARKPKIKHEQEPAALLRLDFGCGPHPREGFEGVDSIAFPGVKYVLNVGVYPFPWPDNSVEEANASHFVEHLTATQRVHFINELYRVLKPKGTCLITTPHWASNRAYGDPTHQWPPVAEMWFYYLSCEWRKSNAPHTDLEFNPNGFNCNFAATWGYNLHADLAVRNPEYVSHAIAWNKEAAQDIVATLTKEL